MSAAALEKTRNADMLGRLKHLLWCAGRTAIAIEIWVWPWLPPEAVRERINNGGNEYEQLSLHCGPLSLRFRWRFWPDTEEIHRPSETYRKWNLKDAVWH